MIPRDGISNSIRTDGAGFEDLGYPVVPATGDNTSQNLRDGYTAYTNSMHGTGVDYQSYTSNDHEDAARSAIPDPNWDNSRKTKWYSMPMAMWNPTVTSTDPTLKPNQLTNSVRSAIAQEIIDNDNFHSNGFNLYQAGINLKDVVTHLASSTTTDQSAQQQFSVRAPIASELRYDAWDAIAWGAKGIIFNTAGSDRSANVGICDEELNSDYDSWNWSSNPWNVDNVGLIDKEIGDCIHPFFTSDPASTQTYNYTKRLIQYSNNQVNSIRL